MSAWRNAGRVLIGVTGFLLATSTAAQTDPVTQAVVARDAGQYGRAILLLRGEVAKHPNDADLLRQLGITQAYAKHYGEAIATLSSARILSPRDEDIALALARAYLWSGHWRDSAAVVDQVARADPANLDLAELRRDIASERREGRTARIDLAESLSDVTFGLTHRYWYETAIALAVPVSRSTTIATGVDVEDRQSSTDARYLVRIDRRIGHGSLYVGATATPAATFREHWSAQAGGELAATSHLTASLDVRRAAYVGGVDVTVVEPGITWHSHDERYSLSLRSSNLWGDDDVHRFGWSLRGAVPLTRSTALTAGVATYPDTEAGITRTVHSAFVGISVPLTHTISAQLTMEREDRRDTYVRTGGTAALAWRFR